MAAMMNRLLNLLNQNKERAKPLEVKNEGDTTHVYLFDAIGGWWGVEAESFIKTLNDISDSNIVLHINSPGGDVFAARAIATAIKQHSSNITAQIDGLCASAATYISAACKSVSMADGGFYMVHEGWTLAIGNKRDLSKTIALLEKVDNSIVNDYQKKTGADRDQIVDWMEEETWFSAEEAKEHGFIDSIIDEEAGPNNAANWNLSAYANAPAALVKNKVTDNKSDDDDFDIEENKEFLAKLKRQTEALALAHPG
ncbi:MAG: Clp protease ClpP [Saccharospirillaceae bacterium]|jgi:ATP-dependent protease ClpP protease subunit|nr:Clp protease ClpP [Saccharospirillaceae bacterium]